MGGFNHGKDRGDERSLTQLKSEVWRGTGAESREVWRLLHFKFAPFSSKSWSLPDYSDFAAHLTYLLSSGKSSDWDAEPSFNLRQLKRICLPGVPRVRKQTDRHRVLKKHSTESLGRCVNLRKRKEAALTCWVTPRLRSVFFVFLIYRWLSEHKRAPEMLKNTNGTLPHTPPPLLLHLPSLTSKSKTEAGRWRRRTEEYEAWEEGSVGCD